MKKAAFSAIVFSMAFVSCQKDYTCTCVNSDNGQVEATTYTVIHATRSVAKKACSAGNESLGVLNKTCTIQ